MKNCVRIAALGCLFSAILSCARTEPEEEKGQLFRKVPFVDPYVGTHEPIDFFHTLEFSRSGCLGTCPAYRVVVHGDGTVEFNGDGYTTVKGPAKGKLSPEQMADLVAAINAVKFFALRDSFQTESDGCPSVWTCNPSMVTTIKSGPFTKTVNHYYGCSDIDPDGLPRGVYPKMLTDFETRLDQIIGTEQWVGKRRA
jgi:hypothetical protein